MVTPMRNSEPLGEHGGAGALFFVEGAVGGVEVAEVDVVAADFEDAVMAGDFGIVEVDVGAVAAEDDARFGELVRGAFAGAGDDGEDDGLWSREAWRCRLVMIKRVLTPEALARANEGSGEMTHGGFRAAGVFDDGRAAAPGAAELHFGVRADIGVLQHVFRAAVGASCLHGTKVAALRGVAVDGVVQGCRKGNVGVGGARRSGLRSTAPQAGSMCYDE